MKLRFMDMLEKYIEDAKAKAIRETERSKRFVLEDFGFFMDEIKGTPWKLEEITEEDARAYFKRHKQQETSTGQAERRIQIVNHFMDYAAKRGWIKRRPWRTLAEEKKHAGYFKLSREENKRVLEYLKGFEPSEFFKKRDRAMLLILIGYSLWMSELSRLNVTDYNGKTLKITSVVKWRDALLRLKDYEAEALDDYLTMRRDRKEAEDEEALFIGLKRGRIAAGVIKNIIKFYLDKTKEEKDGL